MKKLSGIILMLPLIGFLSQAAQRNPSPSSGPSPVLQALQEEITRAANLLKQKANPAPYFISYSVNEINATEVEADLGALMSNETERSRLLDVDVRVGDYQVDSTHQIRGQRTPAGPAFSYPVAMPLDNDVAALKSVIWLETDRKYKAALERFIQVRANRAIKVDEEDTSADLSREPEVKASLPLTNAEVDSAAWEKRVKEYSALFKKYPESYDGTV